MCWKKKLKEKADADREKEKLQENFPVLPVELRKKILSYIEDYWDSKKKPPH